MIKRWVPANAVFLAVLAAILISGCHADTEQDKVKKVVHKVQQAAENKDIKQVLSYLSKTYKDPQGNTYNDIKDLLLYYFFRHAKISVFITDLEVRVDDSAAQAVFQAILTGRNKTESAGDILPEALGAYNFDVTLALESGEWRIVSAKWDRPGETPPDKSQ
jgi:tRNA A37 methylthiotransferase MiaB